MFKGARFKLKSATRWREKKYPHSLLNAVESIFFNIERRRKGQRSTQRKQYATF